MQSTKIMAIAAVAIMAVAAAIGLGYAFQAQYTDIASGTGEATGQILRVTDANSDATKAIIVEDGTASTLYLDCGTDVTKTAADTYTRNWDSLGAILSSSATGKTAITTTYDISPKAVNSSTITVKALYCLGAYKITAPQDSTAVIVTVSDTGLGAASQTATGYTAGTNNVFYTLSDSKDYNTLAAEHTKTLNVTAGTTATTVYLYATAVWVLEAPTADAPSVILNLSASTPIITATADKYGA